MFSRRIKRSRNDFAVVFIRIFNKKSQQHLKTFQIFALRKRRYTFNNNLLSFKIRFLPLLWYNTPEEKKCYRYCYSYSKSYICFIKKSHFAESHHLSPFKPVFTILEFQRSLQHFSDLSYFILYTKTYILAIHLSTYHDYAYYKYSALCLLRIFINDFKKINRRVSL